MVIRWMSIEEFKKMEEKQAERKDDCPFCAAGIPVYTNPLQRVAGKIAQHAHNKIPVYIDSEAKLDIDRAKKILGE